MRLPCLIALCAFVLPLPLPVSAADDAAGRNPADGWFFYRERPEVVPPEVQPPVPQQPTPAAAIPAPAPVIGSVAWIRANLDAIRDRAIDSPTEANVALYAYVQKLMMDKSEVFGRALVQVSSLDPGLDETIRSPTSSPARMTMYADRDRAQGQVLDSLAGQTALWYFFRSDCPYCHRQNPLVQSLADTHGFSVLPISIDHKPMSDGSFLDWIPDGGQARYLGIEATPTIYIVKPPDQVVLLSVGMRSYPELAERLVEVARAQGWIDERTYQEAVNGLPRQFLADGFNPETLSDPNDPEQLLEALRASAVHGRTSARLSDLEAATPGTSTPIAYE